jgi:pyruvate dehydrogenase E1 component beta subunit
MEHNPEVFMIGQDIVGTGGVFRTAEGLAKRFGTHRIIESPISETAVMGLATGAAMAGMRPLVEMAYIDFVGVCFNAIANFAAKTHYMSGGQFKVPLVLVAGTGGGYSNAAQHSQCLYSLLAHMPGMKIVVPSNAYDAKGLMHSAIRDENFVVFLYAKAVAGLGFLGKPHPRAMMAVPEEPYTIPIGKARVTREGTDVTIVGLGWTSVQALDAADVLEREGISAEVVDLRSIVPLDRETVCASVAKTGHLIVVDEDYGSYGVTAEVIASVAERVPHALKSPARRLAFPDIPIPFARQMEYHVLPSPEKIVAAARSALGKG